MAGERDRIVEITEYLSSLGICVNVGRNKARGHNGFFMHRMDNYRIDISRNIDSNNVLSVILHEFAHYIHYLYDNTLSNLNFIFDNYTDALKEELISITVNEVPKEFASSLYNQKNILSNDVKFLSEKLKQKCPDFKLSQKYAEIEQNIKHPLTYLLKYDNVKYFDTLYTVRNLDEYNLTEEQKTYLNIKSKQRALKRINSRINKLNKYYNNASELFARFIDSYYTKPEYTEQKAPIACGYIRSSDNPYLKKLNQIFSQDI